MNLSDKVNVPPEVMARTVGDETVILDLTSGTYFGLDPVGARIWQLLTEGKSLSAVCDAMLETLRQSGAQSHFNRTDHLAQKSGVKVMQGDILQQ